jgi:hypothetical protein
VRTHPIGNHSKSSGRHCLFDVFVFARCPTFGVLEQMIHPGQLHHRGIGVVFQCFASGCKIFFSRHLHIKGPINHKNGQFQLG